MHLSQLIIGILFVIGGVALTILSFFAGFFILIYGLPLLVVGVVILLNQKEDIVEPIKKNGGKKSKWVK